MPFSQSSARSRSPQHATRAGFDAGELAVVLSHYDLGTLESVTEFARGSRRNPKVGIVSQRGKFLLKRRALEHIGQDRVRFIHRVQAVLQRKGFPVAPLLPTRDRSSTFVQLRDHLYELFQFIPGHGFARTPEESRVAGEALARFHMAIKDAAEPLAAPDLGGDYHDARMVRTGLNAIGSTLSAHDSFSGDEAELATLVQFLMETYDDAAEAVNAEGFADWPQRLIHSDWHPGNILFRDGRVVAVVDYDAMRFSPRVVDVANGALQFSILAGVDPVDWPEDLDLERFKAFLGGYDSLSLLDLQERAAVPHLMAEALITECVAPVVATGSMGRWSGFRVLQMVRRKLTWMRRNVDLLRPV